MGGHFGQNGQKIFHHFWGKTVKGTKPIFQLVGAIPTKGNALYIFFVQSRR